MEVNERSSERCKKRKEKEKCVRACKCTWNTRIGVQLAQVTGIAQTMGVRWLLQMKVQRRHATTWDKTKGSPTPIPSESSPAATAERDRERAATRNIVLNINKL